MHLAAAAGCPTLGLFGPTDEELSAPVGPYARVVRGPRTFEEVRRSDPQLSQPVCHMIDMLGGGGGRAPATRLLGRDPARHIAGPWLRPTT